MSADKNTNSNEILVVTPIGTALFGYAEEDHINWNFPEGEQQLTIVLVAQILKKVSK
ncbi:GreA/GreB family elongation factor [Aquimarina sp. W85]|uniref:GreA/GreB family elongation factor n=1 Tax=Aquimarina rhodophyticola TaxID=3342246 RepID=UPI003671C2B8